MRAALQQHHAGLSSALMGTFPKVRVRVQIHQHDTQGQQALQAPNFVDSPFIIVSVVTCICSPIFPFLCNNDSTQRGDKFLQDS